MSAASSPSTPSLSDAPNPTPAPHPLVVAFQHFAAPRDEPSGVVLDGLLGAPASYFRTVRLLAMTTVSVVACVAGAMLSVGRGQAGPQGSLTGYGLGLTLPVGWHGRIYRRAGGLPILQVGNFSLPSNDDDVGTEAIKRMRAGSILIVLLESPRQGKTGFKYQRVKLPIQVRSSDFLPLFEGVPASHAFARRLFSTHGRRFMLWVQFGVRPAPAHLLRAANRALDSLTVDQATGQAAPGARAADTSGTVVVAGYRLYPAPAPLAGQCRRAQKHVRFPVLCPTLMPRTCDAVPAARACPELPQGDKGILPSTGAVWANESTGYTGIAPRMWVGGSYGTEGDPYDWTDNNPNYFFHFFVAEGNLSPLALGLRAETPQRYLGRRRIAGHAGKLFTQVSYLLCQGPGCSYTGHLTFIWHQHGVTYAASLHRWSANPMNRTVLAILAALIAHLKRV
jgi:hypothetical protein